MLRSARLRFWGPTTRETRRRQRKRKQNARDQLRGGPGRPSALQALASVRWGQRRRPHDEPVAVTRLSHVNTGRGVWAPGTRGPRITRPHPDSRLLSAGPAPFLLSGLLYCHSGLGDRRGAQMYNFILPSPQTFSSLVIGVLPLEA